MRGKNPRDWQNANHMNWYKNTTRPNNGEQRPQGAGATTKWQKEYNRDTILQIEGRHEGEESRRINGILEIQRIRGWRQEQRVLIALEHNNRHVKWNKLMGSSRNKGCQ